MFTFCLIDIFVCFMYRDVSHHYETALLLFISEAMSILSIKFISSTWNSVWLTVGNSLGMEWNRWMNGRHSNLVFIAGHS